MTDKFSKRVIDIPGKCTHSGKNWALSSLEQRDVADWGYPKAILSGRNRKFLSKSWSTIFSHLGVVSLYSTAYHSQTNGASERTNQILEIILKHYFMDIKDWKLWPKLLFQFQAVVDNSPNASTTKIPNEIVYGFSTNRPRDFLGTLPELNISACRITAADALFEYLSTSAHGHH